MENSLLNFSLSSFDLANGLPTNGLPTMSQMGQMIDPIEIGVKTEKDEEDKEEEDVIEIIDVGASETSISPTQTPQVGALYF